MAIRIEARMEPNLTRMAQIPRLHLNNDPNVDPNRDKYGRMRRNDTELPEFATESLDCGKIGPE